MLRMERWWPKNKKKVLGDEDEDEEMEEDSIYVTWHVPNFNILGYLSEH